MQDAGGNRSRSAFEVVYPSTVVSADVMAPGAVVGDRYQIESWVGEGGMATVYRATDLATGQRVALKRLNQREPEARARVTAQFEQEFLVLSQLAHPRIVGAYDYGVDERGPFYTMELLDGEDFSRIAPVPYRTACDLGRDVCSALSLIHSRRLVYRDLSPHNVRCTADGLAKLIDFGALAPMGPRRELVGTLPCVAPEVLAMRSLDTRTDLYAFGATFYFLLTRRHAYPARDLDDLAALWRSRPIAPSALVPEIPPALDALVFDLLEADPGRRPQSAAEVMERLRAIGELELDESLLVKNAYLEKPALVGRDESLQEFRRSTRRAREGYGAALKIEGPAGVGLSRFLESCVIDARLAGWLVVRAAGSASHHHHYAAAAALGRELLVAAPRLARAHAEEYLSVLGSVIPELVAGRDDFVPARFDTPEARHRQLQPALRRWFARVAAERPLLVAVDDVHLVDAPSASLLAVLASEARRRRMLIAVTQPSDQPAALQNERALSALGKMSASIVLAPLSPALTHSLLGSVFGEVPNLDLLTRSVHQITGGQPRDVIALSQHLVDEGAVRYEAGSWSLPPRFSAANLPLNMADALTRRVQKLSLPAQRLAYAISREPTVSFGIDECQALLSEVPNVELPRVVEELLDAGVLVRDGERLRCAGKSWEAPLAQLGSEAERRATELGLAEMFGRRKDDFRRAKQLLRAGEHEKALEAMYAFAVASLARTDADPTAFVELMRSLPENWLETFDRALALYEQVPRPPRERLTLINRMAGMVWIGLEADHFSYLTILLAQLVHDSGLDCFADLPADLPPGVRIQKALERAHVRYLAQPEHLRVFDPGSAIKELVKVMIVAMGNIATTSDYRAYRTLPSLAPILPLAPGIALVHRLVEGVGHRLAGRTEEAIGVYEALLKRLDEPDRAGLNASHHLHTATRIMGSLGILEAPMGRASCLQWVEKVEAEPAYAHVGPLICYLYHLWRGSAREARRFKRRFELLQLETNASMDLQHVFAELCAYALASDMTGVRRTVDALSAASVHEAARAAQHYGQAEYHRIRGDLVAALAEVQLALSLMQPGEHSIWCNAAGAHVSLLTQLKRHEEARTAGEAYLARAEAQKLGYVQNFIRCPLSLALSRCGDGERAGALARAAVEVCRRQQISGLVAELAYETCVLVYEASGDERGLQSSLPHCSARFQRAFARHIEAQVPHSSVQLAPHDQLNTSTNHELEAKLATSLVTGRSVEERAALGLAFVTEYFSAVGGVLYFLRGDELVRVADVGHTAHDATLGPWAAAQMERQEAEQHTELVSLSSDESALLGRDAGATSEETGPMSDLDAYIAVPVAHYDGTGFRLMGVLALHSPADDFEFNQAVRLGAELSRVLSGQARPHASLPP